MTNPIPDSPAFFQTARAATDHRRTVPPPGTGEAGRTESIQAPDFWQTVCMATARHALNALRLAEMPLTPGDVVALIASAPRDAADVSDPEFREKSFCLRCLDRAREGVTDEDYSPLWDVYHEADAHFREVIPALSPNTRKLLEESFAGIVRGLRLSEQRLLPVNPSWEERVRYGYGGGS